jgi:hypothetical protein
MGGGGNILQALQSIASSMSSFIKNSQFQFASQVFGFFASAASPGGGTGGETSVGGSSLSDASSVAGGSISDPGSGEINLGTGGFKYLVKNSAGDYVDAKYDPYNRYDGETTFTFVRNARDATEYPLAGSGGITAAGISLEISTIHLHLVVGEHMELTFSVHRALAVTGTSMVHRTTLALGDSCPGLA